MEFKRINDNYIALAHKFNVNLEIEYIEDEIQCITQNGNDYIIKLNSHEILIMIMKHTYHTM